MYIYLLFFLLLFNIQYRGHETNSSSGLVFHNLNIYIYIYIYIYIHTYYIHIFVYTYIYFAMRGIKSKTIKKMKTENSIQTNNQKEGQRGDG